MGRNEDEEEDDKEVFGINYRLNTKYTIDKNDLRKWNKINVKYIEKDSKIYNKIIDKDGDCVFFANKVLCKINKNKGEKLNMI